MAENELNWGLDAAEQSDPRDENTGALPGPVGRRPILPVGEALGGLLGSLQPRLEAVAFQITRDSESARDAVQAAFEKVIRYRERFRGDSRFSTWIHRIVVNEALLLLRNQRRRREVIGGCGEHTDDETPGAAEKLLAIERRDLLHRGLDRLSFEDREVVERCGLSGWTYADYSAHTGIHVAAVKSRAFRARSRLRGLLQRG
jgi:RNA polymerase sigma-70 factor (ECF subfamily)